MIVSKNSWHFKLNSNWGGHDTRYDLSKGCSMSLCKYFWETVKSLIGLLLACVCTTALIGLVGYVVLAPITLMFSSFTGIWWDIQKYYEFGLLIMLAVILVSPLVAIFATLFGPMKVFPKWFPVDKWVGMAVTKAAPTAPKKVNILVEWIKAKKSKVCPIVEFKGE